MVDIAEVSCCVKNDSVCEEVVVVRCLNVMSQHSTVSVVDFPGMAPNWFGGDQPMFHRVV